MVLFTTLGPVKEKVMPPCILKLSALEATLETVGGKGMSLAN